MSDEIELAPPAGQLAEFRHKVWDFYRTRGRSLPWRQDVNPYGVFVSEIMLQQTQVSRVTGYWTRWMGRFDSFESLASASINDMLAEWQGLGYNRRALWMRRAAESVAKKYKGMLPADPLELVKLPGVGPSTAGSIAAFAYNRPTVFIETNVRRAYIHEFAPELKSVSDRQLMPLVAATVDARRPREWYWALMDYGSDLAKTTVNPNRSSREHRVQPAFSGSRRQLRGRILAICLAETFYTEGRFQDEREREVIEALEAEGFIVVQGRAWRLKE